MNRRLISLLALGCLLLPSEHSVAADSASLPHGSIKVSEQTLAELRSAPDVRRLLAELQIMQAAAKSGAVSALCDSDHPLNAGAALALWLDELATRPIGAPEHAALETLSSCPERVWYQHPESASDWWLPAFSNGPRAAALLRLHQQQRLGAHAAALLAKTGASGWDPSWDDRIAHLAVERLNRAELDTLAQAPEILPTTLLVPITLLTGQISVLQQALQRAPTGALLAGLPQLFALVPPKARMQTLNLAISRAELASAAILAAQQWPPNAALDDWMQQHLADPDLGPSVAQVLAQRWTVAQLVAAASEKSNPATTQLNLALALRLTGSPEAEQALQALARSGALPAAASAEVLR